ncbi:MAG: phenylalanine--tRNA ligase subunit alpha [Chrysiogenales bacterium]
MIDDLKKEIEGVRQSFLNEIAQAQSPEKLAALKERYLSRKKGLVSQFLLKLRECPPQEKPAAGQLINQLKTTIETELAKNQESVSTKTGSREQWSDHSLPVSALPIGRFHLIAAIKQQIEDLFLNLGYEIALGPEVELEDYNFTKLNMPEHHPARDEQDTFFLEGHDELVLRTHTSPMQVRYMLAHKPPFKIISPGKAFRKDDPDATHSPCFHQVEGLLVDRGIHFSHLKGTLEVFCRSFFGPDIVLRFRPGYFPFTEPSAEVDISCFMCSGRKPDCKVCKGSGWLELGGSGMVHPQVLLNCGIDSEKYSGFAFGMGIERVAMVKYGVPDLRLLYENDLRLLGQFG